MPRPRKANQQSTNHASLSWRVDQLRVNPLQGDIFDDLEGVLFEELVDSVRHDGIQIPLEILPDGTVICGHQRLRAAKVIGLITVPVVIRHDLAARGDEAALTRMIEDNLLRGQLDPLARARAYTP